MIFFTNPYTVNPLLKKALLVLFSPIFIIRPIGSYLERFCEDCVLVFNLEPLGSGLGLFWTIALIASAIWFGLIFILGINIIEWCKKRKNLRKL